MTAPAWQPCPFCAAELLPDIEGMEHPDSATCPLDSIYVSNENREAWNMRHCHGKDYSYAALIEALSAQLAAANARADGALVEAAERFPDGRQPWPPNAIRKAILALRDKPAPDPVPNIDRAKVAEINARFGIGEGKLVDLYKPAPAVTAEIDLVQVIFAQLCEAAKQSNWIPQEHYYANDWISDCCDFLRTGRGAIAGGGDE